MSFSKAKIHRFNEVPVSASLQSANHKCNEAKVATATGASVDVKCSDAEHVPAVTSVKTKPTTSRSKITKTPCMNTKHIGVCISGSLMGKQKTQMTLNDVNSVNKNGALKTPNRGILSKKAGTSTKRKQTVAFSGIKIIRRSCNRRLLRRSRSFGHNGVKEIRRRNSIAKKLNLTEKKIEKNDKEELPCKQINKPLCINKIKETKNPNKGRLGNKLSFVEKDYLNLLLQEKCILYERMEKDVIVQWQCQIQKMLSIIQHCRTKSYSTDRKTEELLECYENSITFYENQQVEMVDFIQNLERKLKEMWENQLLNEEMSNKQHAELKNSLYEAQKKCENLNIVASDALNVVDILCERLQRNEIELTHMNEKIAVLEKEKLDLQNGLIDENKNVQELEAELEKSAIKLVEHVLEVENGLLQLLKEFEKEIRKQKQKLRDIISSRNEEFKSMSDTVDAYKLKLQEAEDEIALLKAKNENLEFKHQMRPLKNICDADVVKEVLQNSHSDSVPIDDLKSFYSQYLQLAAVIQESMDTLAVDYPSVFNQIDNLEQNNAAIKDKIDNLSEKLEQRDIQLLNISDQFQNVEQYCKTEEITTLTKDSELPTADSEAQNLCVKIMSILEELLDREGDINIDEQLFGTDADTAEKIKNSECYEMFLSCTQKIKKLKIDKNDSNEKYIRLCSNYDEKCSDCAALTQVLNYSEKKVNDANDRICELEKMLSLEIDKKEEPRKEPFKMKNEIVTNKKSKPKKKNHGTVHIDKENVDSLA